MPIVYCHKKKNSWYHTRKIIRLMEMSTDELNIKLKHQVMTPP